MKLDSLFKATEGMEPGWYVCIVALAEGPFKTKKQAQYFANLEVFGKYRIVYVGADDYEKNQNKAGA